MQHTQHGLQLSCSVARDDLSVKKLPGITQGSLHFSSKTVSTGMESSDLLKIWARQTLSKGRRNARLKKKNLNII